MAGEVLDSFALLAFLRGEDAQNLVLGLLEQAADTGQPLHMTEVNYAEVKYITLRKSSAKSWQKITGGLAQLPIEFHAADRSLAETAADFKARFKMSLADAFAAALAHSLDRALVTGDAEFRALAKEIKLRWIGEAK